MRQKKTILSIFVVVGLILGLGASLWAVKKPQNAAPAEAAYPGGPTLSLTPSSSTVYVGQELTLTVNLNTNNFKATAADVKLTYPHTVLEAKTVTVGTFLPTVLTAPTITNGQINFTVASGTAPKSGSGALATILFKVLTTSTNPAAITFTPQTQIAGIDAAGNAISQNILDTTTGATATIKNYLPGDITKDGKVDIFDYNQLVSDFGKTGTTSDLNNNGAVDIYDYTILVANFGKSS
jgi:hypothetical protein